MRQAAQGGAVHPSRNPADAWRIVWNWPGLHNAHKPAWLWLWLEKAGCRPGSVQLPMLELAGACGNLDARKSVPEWLNKLQEAGLLQWKELEHGWVAVRMFDPAAVPRFRAKEPDPQRSLPLDQAEESPPRLELVGAGDSPDESGESTGAEPGSSPGIPTDRSPTPLAQARGTPLDQRSIKTFDRSIGRPTEVEVKRLAWETAGILWEGCSGEFPDEQREPLRKYSRFALECGQRDWLLDKARAVMKKRRDNRFAFLHTILATSVFPDKEKDQAQKLFAEELARPPPTQAKAAAEGTGPGSH